MKTAPFEAGHLAAIEPAWPFTRDRAADSREFARRAAQAAALGPAWTVLIDGAPAACGGVAPLWDGVGEAWTFAGETVRCEPLAVHRAAARGLAEAERALRLHRVQAACHHDNRRGRRWLVLLGFREEGLMLHYGPRGHHFVRFARVRPSWPIR